jgi:hypothetical protein
MVVRRKARKGRFATAEVVDLPQRSKMDGEISRVIQVLC